MTFSGRYTICVQLCRLNKEKIKSGPCPYPSATFERCTWGSLTAAKHSSVWGKLVLLFRAAFWVFMCWTFWLRGNFVPAALFFCLSSTNLMRINKMNKVFLFNKHNAALTVPPVVLRIHSLFYFKHILCGYSASQNWADSGPCVVMFRPVLEQSSLQEHNDLHWFYYFSTWSIIHFSTLWHKPNYREIEIHCFHVQWCIIMKVLFFSVIIVNSYAMVSKCFACCAEWGRWMNITLDSKL